MTRSYVFDERIKKLSRECAVAIRSHCESTITATLADACEVARRDTGNSAGALLRDRARDLDASAQEHDREGDVEEAALLHAVAHELSKLSREAYALGEPPKAEPPVAVDGDIPF